MAIWQVHFLLVPVEKTTICLVDREKGITWFGYNIKDDTIDDISKHLTFKKSWCKYIKQFGSLEESCIELHYEEQALNEISLRIDLRSISLNLLKEIINFIQLNNAVILTDEDKIIQPTLEEIVEELKNSEAYRFLTNPVEFLSQLKL